MLSFIKGFEKKAEKARQSSTSYDLGGGLDPTGIYTFRSAKRNALAKAKDEEHARHRALATAGGVAGGIGVVAPLISGTMGAFSKGMSTPGGLGRKALAAGQGFVSGAKKPFRDVYHGVSGGKKLMRGDTLGARPHVEYFAKEVSPRKYQHLFNKQRTRAFEKLPKDEQKALAEKLKSEGYGGLAALGMSGLISGGSAHIQYAGGRAAGEELLKARQNKGTTNV